MKRFWKRDDDRLAELEDELRARRADPPEAFVRAVAQRARRQGEGAWLRPRARIAVAGALTVVALVAVASAGGAHFAKSSTLSAVHIIKHVTSSSPSHVRIVRNSASTAQYVAKCGSPPLHLCEIGIKDVTMLEGDAGCTNFVFTIFLKNGPSNEPVTVNYTTQDGSATVADADYVPTAGTAVIPAGSTSTTVTVCVLGDTKKEGDEKFFVKLSNSSPNAKIVDATGNGTIKNDD